MPTPCNTCFNTLIPSPCVSSVAATKHICTFCFHATLAKQSGNLSRLEGWMFPEHYPPISAIVSLVACMESKSELSVQLKSPPAIWWKIAWKRLKKRCSVRPCDRGGAYTLWRTIVAGPKVHRICWYLARSRSLELGTTTAF